MKEIYMTKKILLTQTAVDKIEAELEALIIRRKEISNEIKEARGFGDLSENAEYHAAREAQSHNESEILRLKEMLENYDLAETSDKIHISLNTKVKIQYMDDEECEDITIVSTVEADPFMGKLSNESPIGSALLGHEQGDIVDVQTPDGIIQIKIVELY